MPQTTWRPYLFAAAAVPAEPIEPAEPKAPTAKEKVGNDATANKRKGGVVTRKEVANCLGLADGGQLDIVMRHANVGMVGTYKNARGRETKLYGFRP